MLLESPARLLTNRANPARTYLTRSSSASTTVKAIDPQMLSKMNPWWKAPYHLINCAVNIPYCKDPNLRGRNTDFFLFSKHYCGSPITGFQRTIDWEAMDAHLDLGTAMAISGAAAAPHMGTLTSARYTFLMAMLNVGWDTGCVVLCRKKPTGSTDLESPSVGTTSF